MNSSDAVYVFAGLFVLIILFIAFTSPKSLLRAILRAASGIAVLALMNIMNIGIYFNAVSASVSALLGVPGALTAFAIQQIL